MEQILRDAILGRKVLTVMYRNKARVVEPYLLYETKNGVLMLHTWQVSGEWERTPPPGWCNMAVGEITSARPTGDHFTQPHAGYNPSSQAFHVVLCQV